MTFLFGVHNHQPAGNFDDVMADAVKRAYQPFLELARAFPSIRLTVHCTGTLLEFLRDRAPRAFDLLGALAARGQIELLTGGFYEPILPVLPDHDKIGQIQHLSEFLKSQGVDTTELDQRMLIIVNDGIWLTRINSTVGNVAAWAGPEIPTSRKGRRRPL